MPREHRTHSLSQRAHRVSAHARARREHMRARGPLNWDTVAAKKGPRALAIKNHFIAMLGEYVGTVLFMIFALGGTNVALIPNNSITGDTASGQDGSIVATVDTSNLLYISLSFGFSLAVNAWIFFRISGGLFNPAVSLGMVLVRALTPLRGALLSISQILGGITGAAIIQAITPGTLNVTTALAGGTSVAQGLFIEMFLTSLLMLAILLLAAEKHKATFIAPIGIGLALFVAELLGVYYTGGSLNPARSFGPAVVLKTFDSYHWIYWLGPALGSIIAAGFYKLLKFMQYETVLGPEGNEEAPHTGNASGTPDDAEKGQSGDYSGPTADISGPGLGDLHTIDGGNSADVYDLEERTGSYESRLINIEYLLEYMIERDAQAHGHGRPSDLTYVESSPRQGSKHIDDNHHHEKQPLTHQLNGGPRGAMATQSVAGAPPIAAVYHNGEPVADADNGGMHPSSVRGGASNVSGQPKSNVSRSNKSK